MVKYYLDEHVHSAIAAGLRRRGVDVLTTQDAGLYSASDSEQLALAVREGRVLFTQDVDFCVCTPPASHTLGSFLPDREHPLAILYAATPDRAGTFSS